MIALRSDRGRALPSSADGPARQHIGPALEFLDLPDCKHLRPSKFREWRRINVVMTVASIRGGSAVVPDRGAVITTSCALPREDSNSRLQRRAPGPRQRFDANAGRLALNFHRRKEWTSSANGASLSPCRDRACWPHPGSCPAGNAATVGLRW